LGRPSPARRRWRRAAALSLLVAGCLPDVDIDASVVLDRRIAYVTAAPAEVAPGETVSLAARVVAPEGDVDAATVRWASCLARRPLTEQGPVATTCLDPTAKEVLVVHGEGASIDVTIDDEVCRRFGPEPPPTEPGEPAGRPTDPDATGGYYQPLQVWDQASDGPPAIVLLRVDCGIAGATQALSAEHRRRYQANRAPVISALRAAGEPIALDGTTPLRVGVGERLGVEVSWPECPLTSSCGDGTCTLDEDEDTCASDCEAELGCAGAEQFVTFTAGAKALEVQRESISLTWLTTIGSFRDARTGRGSDELDATSSNELLAPREPGAGRAWIVIRDARGAVDGIGIDVIVE